MFFDFDVIYDVLVEQYVGNQIVSRQRFSAPKEVLMMQFMGLCEETSRQPQPIKLRMVRYEEEWNQIEQQVKRLEYSIEFRNNAFERG